MKAEAKPWMLDAAKAIFDRASKARETPEEEGLSREQMMNQIYGEVAQIIADHLPKGD